MTRFTLITLDYMYDCYVFIYIGLNAGYLFCIIIVMIVMVVSWFFVYLSHIIIFIIVYLLLYSHF